MVDYTRAYLVCSTQRSGSTYLCRLLASTGVAGDPQEFFEAMAETGLPPRPSFFLAGLPRAGASVKDDPGPAAAPEYSNLQLVDGWRSHLERTFRLGTTGNGVFSAKLMWNQLPEMQWHAAALPELAGLGTAELLSRLFSGPAYVWVRRRDQVRQAISLWRALQTGAWRRDREGNGGESEALHYNFDAIDHLRRRLDVDDRAWGRFFGDTGIEPLELVYEDDIERRPDEAVASVLAHVGVEQPALWEPGTSMLRQSDDLNDAWLAAYDRDAAARQVIP